MQYPLVYRAVWFFFHDIYAERKYHSPLEKQDKGKKQKLSLCAESEGRNMLLLNVFRVVCMGHTEGWISLRRECGRKFLWETLWY